ncbi:hypothetical protein ACO0LF_07165 [Undibacterium sp. Di27W]|uniref:hypothetical protein n=1 Tax=Undibacterium sp. Di27W TaxID=3413036 RepID=UPI003BF1778C
MKKLTKFLVVPMLLASVSACTSTKISQNLASGAIGCSPTDIGIFNEKVSSGVHTFMASCGSKKYFCTYLYPNPIACKEQTAN